MRRTLPLILLSALPLCAARPAAVQIVLKADPAPEGVSAPDTNKLTAALQAFAQRKSLAAPATGGDEWILGVRITPLKTSAGFIAAKAIFRLAHLDGGKVTDSGAKESMSLITAADDAHWDEATVSEAWALMGKADLVADLPVLSQRQWKKLAQPSKEARVAFDFAEIPVVTQPPMPKMADVLPVKGASIMDLVDIDLDAQGHPEAVIGRKGTDATLVRAGAWFMSWTFTPGIVKGTPVRARFTMNMVFTRNIH